MVKSCVVCRAKAKTRCDKCGNEFCHEHAIICSSCGTITCIRDLPTTRECPVCKKTLEICPECFLTGRIVRTIPGANMCPQCGWGG